MNTYTEEELKAYMKAAVYPYKVCAIALGFALMMVMAMSAYVFAEILL